MNFKKYSAVFLLGCFAFLAALRIHGNLKLLEEAIKVVGTEEAAIEAVSAIAEPVAQATAEAAKNAAEETAKTTLLSSLVNGYKWSKEFIEKNPKTAFFLGIAGTTGIFLCEKWFKQYLANKSKLLKALGKDKKGKNANKQTALELAKKCYLFFPTKALEKK